MDKTSNRHRVRYRGQNLYIVILPEKREVFISRIETEDNDNDFTAAGLDTIARLTSKLWQEHESLDIIIDQLGKASRVPSDMPGILKVLLEDYQQ